MLVLKLHSVLDIKIRRESNYLDFWTIILAPEFFTCCFKQMNAVLLCSCLLNTVFDDDQGYCTKMNDNDSIRNFVKRLLNFVLFYKREMFFINKILEVRYTKLSNFILNPSPVMITGICSMPTSLLCREQVTPSTRPM